MNLKEAEALVEKNLPIWNSIASSNFAGFAELLVEDYRDWARDTLESINDSSMTEDEFDRTLEAWELVAVRYLTAMCRPVPSFKTADGVTCYVGDLVYCKDGKQHEVTEICLNGEIVYVSDGGGSAPTEAAMVAFYQPEPPRSLKVLREQVQAEREAEREAKQAKNNELQSAELAEALNNRGSYHERLVKILTEGAGHVGIVSKYAFSNIGETFPESEEGAKALKWWTDREVNYTFTASGLVLYIGSYHSNWHDLKYIDYQAWDND